MNLRFVGLCLILVHVMGCREIIEKLAKKDDAGAGAGVGSVASAEPAPPPTTTGAATDDDDPPAPAPGPAGTPTAKTAAAASPRELEKTFAALDINDDDQLDGVEVKNCGCAIADANGDGEITKAEYLAAGLLGKFRPGTTPTGTAKTTPTPAPPAPPPSPVASGLPPGSYRCSALVGGILSTMGTLRIIDGSRYSGSDGSGAGNYTFDPGTKAIRFTSGMYADPSMVKSAQQISERHIKMRQGKSGFTVTDCKR